jgi:hypothetical protein
MASEPERHVLFAAASHRHRLVDDAHALPATLVAVLVPVGRVGLVDVEILFVAEGKDRQAESDAVVVPERDARQRGFSCTDHVPARRMQVDHVAQRWHADRAMGVVGENRFAGRGAPSVHRPVVALVLQRGLLFVGLCQRATSRGQRARQIGAGGMAQWAVREVVGLERQAVACQGVLGQDIGRDGGDIDPLRYLDRPGRLLGAQRLRRVQPDRGDAAGHRDLGADVARDAVDADQRRGRRPATGLGACEAELERHARRVGLHVVDIGVDAVGERGHDLASLRVIAGELGVQVAAEQEPACRPVGGDVAVAELLGHLSFTTATPLVELPETVAGRVPPLGEEKIALVPGIYVRHAMDIAHDFYRLAHSGHRHPRPLAAVAVVVAASACAQYQGCRHGRQPMSIPQLHHVCLRVGGRQELPARVVRRTRSKLRSRSA